MKEASGELSMTAITVVAIAAIGGIFTTLIYPRIKVNIINQTNCATKMNCSTCTSGKQTCQTIAEDGTIENNLVCPCSADKDVSAK